MAVVIFLINLPSVQTKVAQKISTYLSQETGSDISINEVSIRFFDEVNIHEIYIRDLHQDTLLYGENLKVNIGLFNLFDNELIIDRISLYKGNIELKKYEGEPTFNYQFLLDYFSTEPDEDSSASWTVELNEIQLFNSSFIYSDENKEAVERGVDFNHIQAKSIALDFDNISFIEDTIRFTSRKLKFNEKSGFQLRSLSGLVDISPKGIVVNEMELTTPTTSLALDLKLATDSFGDFNQFNDRVELFGNFSNSNLNSKDLGYFVPEILDMKEQFLQIEGVIRGKVSNLKGRKLKLILNEGSEFIGNLDLKGLPDIQETFMYLKVDKIETRASYISSIPTTPFDKGGTIIVPEILSNLGTINFKGNFTGFLSDFVAYGELNTAMGSISTDISVKGQDENASYSGSIASKGFNLGKILQNEPTLGNISLNVEVNGKGLTRESLQAKVKGVVNTIEVNKRSFKNIVLKGEVADQLFNGDLIIKDELLDMDFIGSVDFRNELPELNFLSNINQLKIGQILDYKNIDSSSVISTTMNIDLIGNNIDNLTGKFELYQTIYKDDERSFEVEMLQLRAEKTGENRSLNLTSDLLDARLSGNFKLEDLAKSSRSFIDKYIPAIVGEEYVNVDVQEDFDFTLTLKRTELISALLFPGYEVDSGAYLEGYYNSIDNQLTLDMKLNGAKIKGVELSPGLITVSTQDNSLFLNTEFNKVGLGSSFTADNFTLVSETKENKTEVGIIWNNRSETTSGNINFNTEFVDLENFEFVFNHSEVRIADTLWKIPDSSRILIDSSAISFENFALGSNQEMIEINGKVSENPTDELNFKVDNFDLSLFNLLIPEKSLKLNGRISGLATLKDPYNNLIFTSNIDFDGLTLNDNLMGSGSVKSFWLNEMNVLHVDGKLLRGKIPTIQITGNYFPNLKEDNINMSLTLQNTYLQLFQPYVDGTLSNLRGLVTGKVDINGSLTQPLLKGNLQLQKAGFTLDYLNTSYSFSDNIIIRNDWIGFDNISLYDSKQGKAAVTGTIFHDNFKDFNMDIFLIADKFHCLNTTLAENELYYGQAFVTGEIDVSGYADNLVIDVDVKTEKSNVLPKGGAQSTIFNIPLNTQSELTENQFVRFVNNGKPEKAKLQLPQTDLKGIQMNFNLDVTTDAEVRLIFDEKVGDILKGKGNGNLKLQINTDGNFNIYGEYVIDEGDYLFTLQNIINKRFSLQRGSSISWNGDPYEGIMDITAIYKTRARLSDIIITADSNSSYTKRTPVELLLKMENTVLSPDISFDINLPNSDENTKGLLRNVLYVGSEETNENLMNKQAFSLLILNRFTPPDQGISGTGFGATSSSEVLSNQLSNWLSQISKDVDLGFAYRPGDELSNDEVELFVSAEIFNDRVVVSGNFEYGGSQTVNQQQNTNNLVGEGSVEYKIKDDGKFRVKAFNKANNNSFLENTNPYTQGVGLSYRQEFDTAKQFFRSIFVRKKNRQQDN